MWMTPDECFEFDYFMQMDKEARETQEREDRENEIESLRNYRSSWNFYRPRNITSNTSNVTSTNTSVITPTNNGNINYNKSRKRQIDQPKINWWCLIFLIIIVIFFILYNIDEARHEKRREEWKANIEKMKFQELLESETNSWYEGIPKIDLSYEVEKTDELKENLKLSPYYWCSYIWDDWEWHKCEWSVDVKENIQIETTKKISNDYIPEFHIPDTSYTPVAQIPSATIPTATIPKSSIHTSYEEDYDNYYDDYWYDYYWWYGWYDNHYDDYVDEYWYED